MYYIIKFRRDSLDGIQDLGEDLKWSPHPLVGGKYAVNPSIPPEFSEKKYKT